MEIVTRCAATARCKRRPLLQAEIPQCRMAAAALADDVDRLNLREMRIPIRVICGLGRIIFGQVLTA